MKILVLAYEWPPVVAAQALRWYYLANGLANRGFSVHVLCPDITSLPPYLVPNHKNIIEHRVWPGPFIGSIQKVLGVSCGSNSSASTNEKYTVPTYLIGMYKAIRYLLDRLIYPDVRTEWYPFARYRLKRLLRQHSFDAVISSHEPGVDLLLGLWAQKHQHLPWIVDLADPLCAPYTPVWRRRLDVWFEGLVLRRADKVILTTDVLRDVLMQRHASLEFDKFSTIEQGAPDENSIITAGDWVRPGKLHIVFTGNFYDKFRNPIEFAKALRFLNSPDIAVTIAGDNIGFLYLFDGIKNVKFLGRLGHFECLALQNTADVLLNIGNTQSFQVPGKIFEYLVTGKNILHIRGSSLDPSEGILKDTASSLITNNDEKSIASALKNLLVRWKNGLIKVSEDDVVRMKAMHGWSSRVVNLQRLLEDFKKF